MENVIIGLIVIILAGATYWIFKEETKDYDYEEERFQEYMNSHWHNRKDD